MLSLHNPISTFIAIMEVRFYGTDSTMRHDTDYMGVNDDISIYSIEFVASQQISFFPTFNYFSPF